MTGVYSGGKSRSMVNTGVFRRRRSQELNKKQTAPMEGAEWKRVSGRLEESEVEQGIDDTEQ